MVSVLHGLIWAIKNYLMFSFQPRTLFADKIVVPLIVHNISIATIYAITFVI